MKIVLSILLLMVTCIYLLPVKEALKAGNTICLADMDDEKSDSNKEKGKDIVSFQPATLIVKVHLVPSPDQMSFDFPTPLHTIETPPPDLV